jgi:hypothetical protein
MLNKIFGTYTNTSLWFQEYKQSLKTSNIINLMILGFKFPIVIIRDFISFTKLQKIYYVVTFVVITSVLGVVDRMNSTKYCNSYNMSMGEEYKELDGDLLMEITFDSKEFKVGDVGNFTITSSSSNKKVNYKGKVIEGRYTKIIDKDSGEESIVCTPISVDGTEIDYEEVSLRFEVIVFVPSKNNQTLTVKSPGQHYQLNDKLVICK